ncbi:hypothetical protein ACFL4N_03795 [Thermodesulfobacteriota bacterium]
MASKKDHSLILAPSESANPCEVTHGADSKHVRKSFDDRRTSRGKALAARLDSLVDSLGGNKRITPAMRILVDSAIRPKLITLQCINDYIAKQETIINHKGEVIPCLGTHYIAFSNALRRDLEALIGMAKAAGTDKGYVPTLKDLLKDVE